LKRQETKGLLAIKRRGWPEKRFGSYVEVYEEPDMLLAIEEVGQVGSPKG
jgi:hypothetical protein